MTPTQRTLKRLREQGFTAEVTEHWNHFDKKRKDLFGFIDILAIKEGIVLGVQATSGSNTMARVEKIRLHENYLRVIHSGIKVQVWGWRKLKREGWQPRIVEM